jgi:hypothetical protein
VHIPRQWQVLKVSRIARSVPRCHFRKALRLNFGIRCDRRDSCRHHYFLANNFTDLSLDSACGSQSNGLSYLPKLGNCIAIDDAAA